MKNFDTNKILETKIRIYQSNFIEELKEYFPEIYKHEGECRFNGCVHISEPGCIIKEMVSKGNISETRYENYKLMFDEIKNRKKY